MKQNDSNNQIKFNQIQNSITTTNYYIIMYEKTFVDNPYFVLICL